MNKSTIYLAATWALILAVAAFLGGWYVHKALNPSKPPVTVTDTVWRWHHDTVRVVKEKPFYKVVERLKLVHDTTGIASDANLLAQNDSTLSKSDSVDVEIPIVQRTYEGENYRAVVQGYRPELVSIDIRLPEYQAPARKWWSVTVGPQVGYGFTPAGWQPYAGLGATIGFSF